MGLAGISTMTRLISELSMMKASGIGVAMGNAEPSVKEAADYITKDIEEDGIFHAMKHFELI